MDTGALSPEHRIESLRRMGNDEFDVVVIGGGVVGCGAALDAVSRGLTVALVEARDYAAGTSSRSSKLLHGGLRYLEMLDFALVREALQERGLLLQTLAPHLARPVPFLYPLKHRAWERVYAGTGVMLYDVMALGFGHGRGMPRHRHLSKRQALRIAPALRDDSLVGALQYFDAQVDDARFTMMLARTAVQYGAAAATGVRVTGFRREGERVTGVDAHDVESGREFAIRARQIVNATGVWTDDLQQMVGRGRFHVNASKGIHLVVPRDRIHLDTGLILRTEKSVLFVIPWGRHWIVGTTDTPWDLDKAHPAASATDIDYLLEHVNSVLRSPLGRADVEGVYAGLRPLLAGETNETSKLSREHSVAQPVPGLIVVAGGKYTTYRVMAKDAIDVAARGLPGRVPESCTDRTPLAGASGFSVRWNERFRLASAHGLHVARIEHLLRRYGTLTDELLALVDDRPELGQPLPGADDYLKVEAVYAASHEGILHVEDVLTRRIRASIETWDRGVEAAEEVARLIAPILGWDQERTDREVEHYKLRVEAERLSQEQADDSSADAARLGAPDLVPQ